MVFYRPSIPLPCNVSVLNEYVCSDFNREGQLCGKCKNGFAPSVYSYSLRCVKISNYRYKWIKYIGVAFGPLTIFFLFISVLHISPTSPYLHGFIFYSHIISLPMNSRLITLTYEYHHSHKDPIAFTLLKLLLSVFGFWSLDFFRLFYNPFCIHPSMTTLHALALDYVIAVYPLLLLVLTYLMIKLHSRRCRLVVFLWRLFRPLLRILQSKLSIKTSLIDSFATVFMLSTIKFQSVTFDLLLPTRLYFMNGSSDGKRYLFLAGDVEFFGKEHLPYGILALCIMVTLIITPAVLMFLYPCRSCQNLLNHCHCNFQALRTFMDVFQGSYKDGTNNSKDYRFFSGLFFLSRTFMIAGMATLKSIFLMEMLAFIFIGLTVLVAVLRPHKSQLGYTMDILFTSALSAFFFVLSGRRLVYSATNISALFSIGITTIVCIAPLLYTLSLIVWLSWKIRLPQTLLRHSVTLFKRECGDSEVNNELAPILPLP